MNLLLSALNSTLKKTAGNLHYYFLNNICQQYNDSSICSKVIFELTETIVAEDIRKLIIIMNQLKQLGLRFSMDDFGTGYSSLSYITQLPIDELKIDRSFVSNLNDNEQNMAMVSTILNMAKTFGLSVVAEGVKTSEQVDFLVQNHCDILQGFYFSKPVSKEEFEILYANNLQGLK
ncbi:MAG: EAL domain-containing protein [Gammaproteobacteria bacterium]|nr:EAL domain-containing protein [Gammaproteobacteria bacterium]